ELTQDELAKRSGKPADYVARLVDLAIIAPRSEGGFRPTDIQRVRLIDALARSGIRLEDPGRPVRSGALSFAFVDFLFDRKGNLPETFEEVCARFGWSMDFVERVYEVFGLPIP